MNDLTYEQALAELQQLVDQLQDQSLSLDELESRVRRARELLRSCREKLRHVEDVSRDLLDDLGGEPSD